ncbi:hypothetical protein Hypma_015011 [Hypsizygus marmoreus]|uniref:Uncharacterized protein n=1 Tax=Hypsizygus marmoreus TaxID=39966 RepID=A0A369K5F6_HYPMA|nr:hypothetical protein Hypma_015011 [Hypsizygus marmoreus]
MKSPPECFSPANPDITGIGIRISLYAQSFLTILISVIAHLRKRSPDSVAAIWRVQFYSLVAFYIAGIVQRATNNLSQFHETAAYHLGTLLLYSAFVGMLIEVPGKDAKLILLATGNPRAHSAQTVYHLTSHSATARFILQCAYMLLNPIFGILIALDSNCDGHVTWVFLFGAQATEPRGFAFAFIVAPPVSIFFLSIIYLVTFCFLPRWKYKMNTLALWIVFFYLLFWAEEVVAIERSLKANPGLDQITENAWQFGQIVPLVLLIPYFETLIEQIRTKISYDSLPGPGGGGAEAVPLTSQSALPPRISTPPESPTHSLFPPHHSLSSRTSEP